MLYASGLFWDAIEFSQKMIFSAPFLVESRLGQTCFTRKGKISFDEMIMFMLNLNKRSLQLELDHFFKTIKDTSMTFTKQAFSERRLMISPAAFILLNDAVVDRVYRDGDHKTYKGYRLLAIDGSTSQLQNTEELRNAFGYAQNKKEQVARARVSGLYDIKNRIIIDARVAHYDTGERELAVMHLIRLKERGYKNDLILLDRGYPSRNMIHLLNEEKIAFLMRVSRSFLKEINAAKGGDTEVSINVGNKVINLRVIKLKLDSGEEEILVTNLVNEFIKEDFKALYFERWGVETKYNELKNILEIENYTGHKPIAIEQDFYATIYLSNMASLAANAANDEVTQNNNDKELKYQYKTNMNILIGKLKDDLVLMMLQQNPYKRQAMFNRIMKEIIRNVVPIRPGRTNKRRKKFMRNKYPMNSRRAL